MKNFKNFENFKNLKSFFKIFFVFILIFSLSSCGNVKSEKNTTEKKKIIATTTMLYDLAKEISKDEFDVDVLMQVGVDPHLYKPTARDIERLENSDIILINGLHLEGQMGKVLELLENQKKDVIVASDKISKENLLSWNGTESNIYDPHIWFSIKNWKLVAENFAEKLKKIDSTKSDSIEKNLQNYLKQLDNLYKYIENKINLLEDNQKILVTAHDAFSYFAKEFNFTVKSVQAISTESEASAGDIKNLANFLVEKKIKSVFVESSVPKKTIEALVESCKAKGHEIKIGGELLSDSLGDSEKNNTYVKMYKYNIDTIVDSLK